MTAHLDIHRFRVGHVSDFTGCTGCTVVLAPDGAVASVEVRGMAPGTRETDLLSPWSSVERVHAVVLSGGSAPGLGAADGVVRYLEEQGLGYETPYARIPLVTGAVIYDLAVGEHAARPSADDGYRAAAGAITSFAEGSIGVGTGATVGKALMEQGWMKGGVGFAQLRLPGDVTVGALSVVNAFGDVLAEDGTVLAGARSAGGFLDTHRFLLEQADFPLFDRGLEGSGEWERTGSGDRPSPGTGASGGNTTLSVVLTDARLAKIECALVARMAHDGLARAISPVHTPVDGDTVFVLSAGERPGSVFQVGTAAVDAVAGSIRRAVREARGLGGVPALRDLGAGPASGAARAGA